MQLTHKLVLYRIYAVNSRMYPIRHGVNPMFYSNNTHTQTHIDTETQQQSGKCCMKFKFNYVPYRFVPKYYIKMQKMKQISDTVTHESTKRKPSETTENSTKFKLNCY